MSASHSTSNHTRKEAMQMPTTSLIGMLKSPHRTIIRRAPSSGQRSTKSGTRRQPQAARGRRLARRTIRPMGRRPSRRRQEPHHRRTSRSSRRSRVMTRLSALAPLRRTSLSNPKKRQATIKLTSRSKKLSSVRSIVCPNISSESR